VRRADVKELLSVMNDEAIAAERLLCAVRFGVDQEGRPLQTAVSVPLEVVDGPTDPDSLFERLGEGSADARIVTLECGPALRMRARTQEGFITWGVFVPVPGVENCVAQGLREGHCPGVRRRPACRWLAFGSRAAAVLRLDMVAVLVPATWTVPGAGPIPTTRNKGFAEGRLEPIPADVGELVTVGMTLPGSLFEAEGTNGAGGRIGVRVGVYDTGGADPVPLVRETVTRLTPNASVSPTHLLTGKGVRTLRRWDEETDHGGSVICDYWAGIKGKVGNAPTSFVLIRIWRTGRAGQEEERLFDDIAGSFLIGGGGSFAGPLRPLMVRTHAPPGSEVVEPGRFRYAGWRLGTVYHSRMISAKEAELATEGGARPRDALLLTVVFLSWIAATLALLGVGPVLLLGGFMAGGTLPQLRSRGLKAVLTLTAFLVALLAFGIVTS
jgi:hypothetical protein